MLRMGWRALTLAVLAMAGAAVAQTVASSYSIGQRTAGQVHSYSLMAHNASCSQALNFRFTFPRRSWLQPTAGSVVRGVPMGGSRPLPVTVDLTNLQPGRHTAEVEVECENCGVLFFRNCQFDKRVLLISIDAVAAQTPTTTTTTRRPTTTTRRSIATTRPTTTSTTTRVPPPVIPPGAATPPTPPTEPTGAALPDPAPNETPTVPNQSPIAAAPSASSAEPACDCAGAGEGWRNAAIAAGVAALAALLGLGAAVGQLRSARSFGGGVSGARAKFASKIRDAFRAAQEPGSNWEDAFDKAREKALDKQIEAAKDRVEKTKAALSSTMQAQLQAMRALSAIGLADLRQPGAAGQVEAWNRVADGAKRFAEAQQGRGMIGEMQEAAGSLPAHQHIFAPLASGGRGDAQMLGWLQQHGFARDEAAASTVLAEMSSYASNAGLSDMSSRLQRLAEQCRRSAAEASILEALGDTQ